MKTEQKLDKKTVKAVRRLLVDLWADRKLPEYVGEKISKVMKKLPLAE